MFLKKVSVFFILTLVFLFINLPQGFGEEKIKTTKINYDVKFSVGFIAILGFFGGYDKCSIVEESSSDRSFQQFKVSKKGEETNPFLQFSVNNGKNYGGETRGLLAKITAGNFFREKVKAFLDSLNFVRTAKKGEEFEREYENPPEDQYEDPEVRPGDVVVQCKDTETGTKKISRIFLETKKETVEGFYESGDNKIEMKFWVGKRGKWEGQIIKTKIFLSPRGLLFRGMTITGKATSINVK